MKTESLLHLIGAQVFLHACMAGMRMAAPLMALSRGYSPLAVGVLLALFAIVQVFLSLPAGRYADRHGLRRPVAIAVAFAAVGALAAVLFPVYPVLCLAAVLTGGATGGASIALQRHVGRAVSDVTDLKRVFSWLATAPALSNFVGPFLAGILIDHAGRQAGDTWGYRAAFLCLALMPVVTWVLVRRVPEIGSHGVAAAGGKNSAWDLLREPMMRRLMIVNWIMSASWDVHTFVVPVIGHERGFSASVIGSLLGAFAIAAAGIRLVIPVFAARLRENAVLTAAMVLAATTFAIYPFMGAAWSMGLCSVLLGMALGCVQPMVMSTLHQITPVHRQGEALGLRMMAVNASSVFMPVMFGSVGAVVGVSLVFWVMGTAVASSARLAWSVRPGAGHGAPKTSAPAQESPTTGRSPE